ncbi:hypothetical protein [Thioalkalivibrio sp. ALE23]|uniref:hypothetical protein n=1 Tax=Thioalkalivibrio sp. ALE23 TaxID=1265495 RepID=UPI0003667FC1|nr:hypothetical protein [Thioalkalivibrio sp. ALE23]
MSDPSFKKTIYKKFRIPENYFEQISNVILGILRSFAWWATCTVVSTTAIVMLVFLLKDLRGYSVEELQEGLRLIVWFTGSSAALAVLFTNPGRFRDVFSEKSLDELARYQRLKNQVESQTRVAERTLVKHGLINESDMDCPDSTQPNQSWRR